MLTHINSLRDTKWGKKLIKNAIKPDGAGGAIITFKGAKGKEKEFYITAEEIVKARQSGIYSSGDDDMIAMELAVEKYLTKYGHLYKNRNQNAGEAGVAIDGNGLNSSEFVELLSGKSSTYNFALPPSSNSMSEAERSYNEKLRMLTEVEKHPGEYIVQASFQGNALDGVTFGKHAYQVKKVVTENGKKFVLLVNPWDSSKTIKMDIDKFIYYSGLITITENPDTKPNPNLRSDLQKEIDYNDAISEMFKEVNGKKVKDAVNMDKIKKVIEMTDSNNIKDLFKSKNFIDAVISILDKVKFGWGNGKEKKELIAPLVDAYCEYAKNKGVDAKVIEDVKKSCYNELDALLYTDEKVIIEKLQQLFDAIDDKENGWKKGLKINIDRTKFGL